MSLAPEMLPDEAIDGSASSAGGHLGGVRPAAEDHQPGQGCSRPLRRVRPAGDQTRLLAYAARIARSRCPTSRTVRSTCTATPTASVARGSGTTATRPRPGGCAAGEPDAGAGDIGVRRPRRARRPGAGRQLRRAGWNPWTSRVEAPHEPTYALVDLDPGSGPRGRAADDRAAAAALEHLGVTAAPRSPAGGASRSGCRSSTATPSTTPAPGSSGSRGRSGRSCPSWSAGSGRSAPAGASPASTTQNAISKTLVAPYSPGQRPSPIGPDRRWDGLDDPTCGRTGGRSHRARPARRAWRPVPGARRGPGAAGDHLRWLSRRARPGGIIGRW